MNIYRYFAIYLIEVLNPESLLHYADMILFHAEMISTFLWIEFKKSIQNDLRNSLQNGLRNWLKYPINKVHLTMMIIFLLGRLQGKIYPTKQVKETSKICGSSVTIHGTSTEDFHYGLLFKPGQVLVSRGALKKFEKDVITIKTENGQKITYKSSFYRAYEGIVMFESKIDCEYFNIDQDIVVPLDGDGKLVDFRSSEPIDLFATSVKKWNPHHYKELNKLT